MIKNSQETRIIDGRQIALAIRKQLKEKVDTMKEKPGLAIILIGDDPGSRVYVSLKEKAAQQAGIIFSKYIFSPTVEQKEIISLIHKLNNDKKVNGIVIQFPLPAGFEKNKIITAIDVNKDVDGFHPDNLSDLLKGNPRLVPGLSSGIIKLIESTGENLEGKKMTVIANSKVFSEPIGFLFKQKGIETTLCSPNDKSCNDISSTADIVVMAVGQPNLVNAEMIKEGAIVIDVGYNLVKNKSVGDVDYDSVIKKAGWLSPVPGGVGPVTVAMLLNNVLNAYEIQNS